ncbi:MFS transporter [Nocardia arthritidis]|uniref:MFS transporter n=1 Tax=Nocardia arthritidis TaxID=228602 RepID=A0A6G9YGU4_9NOCA|nr:MFS transporter [Nocardia arthritidis]QIS12432.1 MFS transporter [Nocardia arthritidis]
MSEIRRRLFKATTQEDHTPAEPGAAKRLPVGVYALGASVFALGTSEFIVSGLVDQIASSIHVSVPQVGQLITAFALGMLIGAPVMAVLTLGRDRKTVLLAAQIVFCISDLLTVIPVLGLMFIMRLIAAMACATALTVAEVMAVALAGPDRMPRAIAVILGGMTLATVAGVPLGSLIGAQFNWQVIFVMIGVMSALGAVLVTIFVPRLPRDRGPVVGLRTLVARELRSLVQVRVFVALATIVLFEMALFSVYAYVQPLLTDVSGISVHRVPFVLFLFGVGLFIGNTIGGRLAQWSAMKNVIGSLIAIIVMMLVLRAVVHNPIAASAAVTILGVCAFSMTAALSSRVIGFAVAAPTLAVAIVMSSFNIGNAIGPAIGGAVIAHASLADVIWVGVIVDTLALATAFASAAIERRRVFTPVP